MSQDLGLGDEVRVDDDTGSGLHEVRPDVAYQRVAIVNVGFVGVSGARWVLVDAGVPGSAGLIARAAERRYGEGIAPEAIVLTHGHFDHVGALEALLERWPVPVYAHPLERPYLDGSAAYPPPDPSVGGGLMSRLSRFFPRSPIDVSAHLHDLASGGELSFLPGWRWLPTPGHTPGHVSLWRELDRTLLAADAVSTTRPESAYAELTQAGEMHGPPAYFTQDWAAARASALRLAALEPEILVPGHGRAMHGPEMRVALTRLAADFELEALPSHGRYVDRPARAADGSAYDASNE